jgi:hypothetical protein
VKQLIVVSAFSALGLVGCGGDGGLPGKPAPSDSGNFVSYFGTSDKDVWAFRQASSQSSQVLDHFDGSTWQKVTTPGSPNTACVASTGQAWIAGFDVFGMLDAQGGFQDFSNEVPGDVGHARSVYCGHGAALAVVNANPPQMFSLDAGHFTAFGAPAGQGQDTVGLASVWSAHDIYLTTIASTSTEQDFSRDAGAQELHYDGSAWTRGTENRNGTVSAALSQVTVAGASTTFPADDVWLNCGANAARFDGKALRPFEGPLPAGNCTFGYRDGHPIVVFVSTASPATMPTAYACDVNGDCSLLDIPGSQDVEYHRMQWNGTAWTGDTTVAKVKGCSGPACGYHGGPQRAGVFGELDDGTLVFEGPASDGGAVQVWFVQ